MSERVFKPDSLFGEPFLLMLMATTMNQETLIQQLQLMTENSLTNTVLVPLFKAFGYDRVDFHGGPDEQGKDLVCWRRDELEDVEVGVVQIKRFKLTRRARSSASFSEVVTQLSQCVETPIASVDGNYYLPSAVYFVTPYSVATRTLQMRFAKVAALRQFRVKIIDGPRLARLIQLRIPHVINSLLGPAQQIVEAIAPQLSNDVLMDALGFEPTRQIKDFNTDLDITIGHPSAQLFLSSPFNPKTTVDLVASTWNTWDDFCNVLQMICELFNVELLVEGLHIVEMRLAETKVAWNKWKEEQRRLNAVVQNRLSSILSSRDAILALCQTMATHRTSTDVLNAVDRILHAVDSSDEHLLRQAIKAFDGVVDIEASSLLSQSNELHAQYAQAQREAHAHNALEPTMQLLVRGEVLSAKLLHARNALRDRTIELNERRSTHHVLRRFIEDCHELFLRVATILQHPVIVSALGLDAVPDIRSDVTRLKYPIETILDTGLNIAVLGEAGAGKTTALQIFASRYYEAGMQDKLVLFAPLSQVARFAIDSDQRESSKALDIGIVNFLRAHGATYSNEGNRSHGGHK